jgi:hypothetical protein
MNYDRYIGLPYKENGRDETGIDCWGLARLFYKQELGIELPSYTELYSGSYDPKVVAAINYYKDTWTKVENPQPGDLCLFSIMGEPSHVGVYIDNGSFLHSRDGKDSVVENINNPRWFNRLQGFYRYTEHFTLPAVGMPHPLQWNTVVETAIEGANAQAFADYLTVKYGLSTDQEKRLILMVDGVPLPQDRWINTYFTKDTVVNYRVVAQGRGGLRTIAMIAVIVAAYYFGGDVGAYIANSIGGEAAIAAEGAMYTSGYTAATVPAAFKIGATLAIQFAGMALVNAAFPIRLPKDPGQAIPTNMFSGTQNQANPFGSIPVVLGRQRVTGLLGAAPFLETLETTSLLRLIVIWGFGPLYVDRSTLSVGSTPISKLIAQGSSTEVYYTLEGNATESSSEKNIFNSYYPTDIQQKPSSPVELTNTTGSPQWTWFTFNQPADEIKIAFNFPDGLRKINTKSGDTATTSVKLAIAIGKENVLGNAVSLSTSTDPNTANLIKIFSLASNATINLGTIPTGYYRKTVVALAPNGTAYSFSGSISDVNGGNPTSTISEDLYYTSYTSLLIKTTLPTGEDAYLWEPSVPNNYLKLASYTQSSSGITAYQDLRAAYGYTFTGLTVNTYSGNTITITSGSVSSGISTTETERLIFLTGTSGLTADSTFTTGVVNVTSTAWKNTFLKQNAVWASSNGTVPLTTKNVTLTASVNFPYTGYYTIDLAGDNWAALGITGVDSVSAQATWDTNVNEFSTPTNSVRQERYITAGTKTITLECTNRETGNASVTDSNCGVALRISFIWDGINNVNPNSIIRTITIDENKKDGFNFIYPIDGPLERATYTVGVKRLTTSVPEDGEWTNVWRAYLYTATAYDHNTKPMLPLPERTWTNGATPQIDHRNLARTAVVVQSTSKVNGTIEGVNALVTTIAKDWDGTAWVERTTNNPASLFRYVLQHTANAFPVADSDINLTALQKWHSFCNNLNPVTNLPITPVTGKPKLYYNNVINSTQNLMELLKDICAAGMASPTFVNGQWSVVVDEARPYTVQHFTPHNSWGFESTKALVRIPHAFRISFPNEAKAYQVDETIVYDWGYAETASGSIKRAEQFETIQFPGVTNLSQVQFFAKWHFAQLHKRPEIYTLNADFEYLVCSRGDKVKVTHDLPMWGTGSARVKSISGTDIVLTEAILFDSTKTYQMLIRKNPSSTGITQVPSTTVTIQPLSGGVVATASNYYDTVRCTGSLIGVEVDNLVMLGETNKVSQDLVVLTIEPMDNTSARMTLCDYAEDIYTTNIDSLSTTFNSNITFNNIDIVKNTISETPDIISVNTSNIISEQISTGNYTNTLIISFASPPSKVNNASRIQIDLIESTALFDLNLVTNAYYVEKDSSSITITGLKTNGLYKIRARYTNNTMSIFGPWTTEQLIQVTGKTSNSFVPNDLSITFQDTFVYVKPVLTGTNTEPSDFETYEFRIYKNSGSGDFWNIIDTINILTARSKTQAVFNLLDFKPSPTNILISASGINYRIACRAVDRTNNYSSTSAVGSILIKTIQ